MRSFFIVLIIAGFTISCSKKAESDIKTDLAKIEEPQSLQKNMKSLDVPLSEQSSIKRLTDTKKVANKKIELNGEFFHVNHLEKLVKGSTVFNLAMKQYGTVKGSLVIVTELNPADLALKCYLDKIAKNTYRLIPEDKEKLYSLYQGLQKNNEIEIVELEIDYSGKNAPVTH